MFWGVLVMVPPEKLFCPLCGSKLTVVKYGGKKRNLLALVRSDNFCCFLGCLHVELHDRVVDGVNYRGKVFIKPIFHDRRVR